MFDCRGHGAHHDLNSEMCQNSWQVKVFESHVLAEETAGECVWTGQSLFCQIPEIPGPRPYRFCLTARKKTPS